MSAPTFEAWRPRGESAGRPPSFDAWRLGDWLNEASDGRGYVPRERYDLALRVLMAAGVTVSRAHLLLVALVARAVEPSRRRPGLSWSAHREVAVLDRAAQDRFLDLAEREGLTCHKLRDAVRALALDTERAAA